MKYGMIYGIYIYIKFVGFVWNNVVLCMEHGLNFISGWSIKQILMDDIYSRKRSWVYNNLTWSGNRWDVHILMMSGGSRRYAGVNHNEKQNTRQYTPTHHDIHRVSTDIQSHEQHSNNRRQSISQLTHVQCDNKHKLLLLLILSTTWVMSHLGSLSMYGTRSWLVKKMFRLEYSHVLESFTKSMMKLKLQ